MADNSTKGSLTKSVTHTIEWDGNKHAWKFNTDSVETWAGIELVKLDLKKLVVAWIHHQRHGSFEILPIKWKASQLAARL